MKEFRNNCEESKKETEKETKALHWPCQQKERFRLHNSYVLNLCYHKSNNQHPPHDTSDEDTE
jgi:hypothetical protein